jgi:hypothetical protein
MMRRRDLVQHIMKLAPAWHRGMVGGLRNALMYGVAASRVGEYQAPACNGEHDVAGRRRHHRA